MAVASMALLGSFGVAILGWHLLGLGWPAGLSLVVALLVVGPLAALALVGYARRVADRRTGVSAPARRATPPR